MLLNRCLFFGLRSSNVGKGHFVVVIWSINAIANFHILTFLSYIRILLTSQGNTVSKRLCFAFCDKHHSSTPCEVWEICRRVGGSPGKFLNLHFLKSHFLSFWVEIWGVQGGLSGHNNNEFFMSSSLLLRKRATGCPRALRAMGAAAPVVPAPLKMCEATTSTVPYKCCKTCIQSRKCVVVVREGWIHNPGKASNT